MSIMIGIAAPASDNTDIWGCGSRRGGRDDSECADSIFQTTKIVLATPRARVLQEILAPSMRRAQGMPDARCTRSLACNKRKNARALTRSTEITRHSLRNGFNSSSVVALVYRAC